MKKIIWISVALLLSIHASAAEHDESIKICTPPWAGYAQKDGQGLYHELWREIFVSKGIELQFKYMPYKRCEVTFTQRLNKLDAYPGGYATLDLISPNWHLGEELLTVVYKKGTISKWEGQISMKDKVVSWERGYDFDKSGVVKVNVNVHEYSSGSMESAFKMLLKDRVDFIVDYNNSIKKLLEDVDPFNQLEIVPDVIKGPKFCMMFANTKKGKKFAEIWDKRMEQLYKSGTLQKMYKRYSEPGYK